MVVAVPVSSVFNELPSWNRRLEFDKKKKDSSLNGCGFARKSKDFFKIRPDKRFVGGLLKNFTFRKITKNPLYSEYKIDDTTRDFFKDNVLHNDPKETQTAQNTRYIDAILAKTRFDECGTLEVGDEHVTLYVNTLRFKRAKDLNVVVTCACKTVKTMEGTRECKPAVQWETNTYASLSWFNWNKEKCEKNNNGMCLKTEILPQAENFAMGTMISLASTAGENNDILITPPEQQRLFFESHADGATSFLWPMHCDIMCPETLKREREKIAAMQKTRIEQMLKEQKIKQNNKKARKLQEQKSSLKTVIESIQEIGECNVSVVQGGCPVKNTDFRIHASAPITSTNKHGLLEGELVFSLLAGRFTEGWYAEPMNLRCRIESFDEPPSVDKFCGQEVYETQFKILGDSDISENNTSQQKKETISEDRIVTLKPGEVSFLSDRNSHISDDPIKSGEESLKNLHEFALSSIGGARDNSFAVHTLTAHKYANFSEPENLLTNTPVNFREYNNPSSSVHSALSEFAKNANKPTAQEITNVPYYRVERESDRKINTSGINKISRFSLPNNRRKTSVFNKPNRGFNRGNRTKLGGRPNLRRLIERHRGFESASPLQGTGADGYRWRDPFTNQAIFEETLWNKDKDREIQDKQMEQRAQAAAHYEREKAEAISEVLRDIGYSSSNQFWNSSKTRSSLDIDPVHSSSPVNIKSIPKMNVKVPDTFPLYAKQNEQAFNDQPSIKELSSNKAYTVDVKGKNERQKEQSDIDYLKSTWDLDMNDPFVRLYFDNPPEEELHLIIPDIETVSTVDLQSDAVSLLNENKDAVIRGQSSVFKRYTPVIEDPIQGIQNDLVYGSYSLQFERYNANRNTGVQFGNANYFVGGNVNQAQRSQSYDIGARKILVNLDTDETDQLARIGFTRGNYVVIVDRTNILQATGIEVVARAVQSSTLIDQLDRNYGQRIRVRNFEISVRHDFDDSAVDPGISTALNVNYKTVDVTVGTDRFDKRVGVTVGARGYQFSAIRDFDQAITDIQGNWGNGWQLVLATDFQDFSSVETFIIGGFGKLGRMYTEAGVGVMADGVPAGEAEAQLADVGLGVSFTDYYGSKELLYSVTVGKFSYIFESQVVVDNVQTGRLLGLDPNDVLNIIIPGFFTGAVI